MVSLPTDDNWLREEFSAALDDAGLPDSADLFLLPGSEAPSGEAAMFSPRGRTAPRRFFTDGELTVRDESNDDLRKHRVFLRKDDHPVLLAAGLRHEVEHARQFEAHGDAVVAVEQSFLIPALRERFKGRGASDLYDLLPSELDAHAAASVFVRRRHEARIEEAETLGPDGSCPRAILSRLGPEPLDTLPRRTAFYAMLFRDLVDDWANREHGTSFGEAIDLHLRGAAALWSMGGPDGPDVVAVPSKG